MEKQAKLTKKQTLTEQQMNEVRSAFDLYDRSGSGYVSTRALGLLLRSLGQNPTQQQIMDMINEFDVDDNEQMDFGEFVQLMTKTLYEVDDSEQRIKEVVRVFDVHGVGHVTVEELRFTLRHCLATSGSTAAAALEEEDIERLISSIDPDNTGKISNSTFGAIISPKNPGFPDSDNHTA